MREEEVKTLLTAGVILLFGIIVESIWNCSNGISRSGALIVCVGIYFGFKDFQQVYIQEYMRVIESYELRREEIDIVHSDEAITNTERGTTNYLQDMALEDQDRSTKRVAIIDSGILIAGTLIWGFGDVVPVILSKLTS